MNPLTPYPITPIGNFFRSRSGAVASHIPDSQAQPRGVDLCHMDRRVLFSDVRQLDYLARQRQCRGPGLVRYW